MVEKLKKWQSDYRKWLDDNPKANEYEWRVALRGYLFLKGLGYKESQVKFERDRTDLRIISENLIPYFIVETKTTDKSIDSQKTLDQALGYLEGGEQYVMLASKRRMKILDPFGGFITELEILDPVITEDAFFQTLHAQYLTNRKNLTKFREGQLRRGSIKVDSQNQPNLDKLIKILRYSSDRLIKYVELAFAGYKLEYAEYRRKLDPLDAAFNALQKNGVKPEFYERRHRQYIQVKQLLNKKYKVAREIFDNSYKIFSHFQPFSKSPSSDLKKREDEIREIYCTDVAYAALNRILFIRIAEDKKLVERKISNSGIHAWRKFVTNLKDKYQELLRIAFKDTGEIYSHFFEANIFDWYIDSDGDLNNLLEDIFYLLNSFDLSRIDSNCLADLYQEYLPAEKRKRLGEFYTPPEIAEYILRSVGYPGEGKLLDFACGSGGFLVPAARMRLEQLKKKGIGPDLRLEALQDIVGLDINPFATHIAEMNMLFVILETYLEAKEKLPSFELKRIPIYTTDSLVSMPPAAEALELFHEDRTAEFVQSFEITEDLGTFKWVVGNPPYVRNERLPEDYRNLYKETFADVAKGNTDLYTFFLRKGIDYLENGGRMGIIVSLGIADSGASEKVRQFIAQYQIERAVSLESIRVFEASTNPIIVVVKKSDVTPKSEVEIINDLEDIADLKRKRPASTVRQKDWLDLTKDLDNSWRVEIQKEDLVIFSKLFQGERIFEANYGLALRDKAQGQKMISDNADEFENPVPLLDGRELRNWVVRWQGRYLNHMKELISDFKPPEFFAPPVVLLPRISRTIQAALVENLLGFDNKQFACRNTVMIVRPTKGLKIDYDMLICLLNNNLNRFSAALILRSGVVQEFYSTMYSRVIDRLPLDPHLWKAVQKSTYAKLNEEFARISMKILDGDIRLLSDINKITDVKTIPFGLLPNSDLSGYIEPIATMRASLDISGNLVGGEKMGLIKGDPITLQFILSYSELIDAPELSKGYLERFPIPADKEILLFALEKMQAWFDEKPLLLDKLHEKEEELDEIIFDNTKSLTKADVAYIKKRIKSHPLNKIIVTTPPGAPTKRIPHKRWVSGDRYKE